MCGFGRFGRVFESFDHQCSGYYFLAEASVMISLRQLLFESYLVRAVVGN